MSQQISSPATLVFRRFQQNKPAVFSAIFLALVVLVALLGYLIVPDQSADANEQQLQLVAQPPGSQAKVLVGLDQEQKAPSIWSLWLSGDNRPTQNKLITYGKYIGDSIQYVPFLEADLGTADTLVVAKRGGNMQYTLEKRRYWLGTDVLGRDLLSRLIIGLRVSLAVGLMAVVISIALGTLLGLLAGYYRGWVDQLIQFLINVTWSIPSLLLVIAFSLALGKGFWQVFLAVGLTMWVEVARIVRGQILSLREKEFVEAARAMGYRDWRIMVKHLLPNMVGPIIIMAASNFASAILVESGLSFLGIGVQPPVPTLGLMIKEHYPYIIMDAAYLALAPGAVILLLVLAFNLMGNGLSDAFDSKVKMS
jgi:peptide/nickel transport system permease protein